MAAYSAEDLARTLVISIMIESTPYIQPEDFGQPGSDSVRAVEQILEERINQIAHYSEWHDDQHGVDHLLREAIRRIDPHSGERIPRSSLVAAGALIIAALELDERTEQDED